LTRNNKTTTKTTKRKATTRNKSKKKRFCLGVDETRQCNDKKGRKEKRAREETKQHLRVCRPKTTGVCWTVVERAQYRRRTNPKSAKYDRRRSSAARSVVEKAAQQSHFFNLMDTIENDPGRDPTVITTRNRTKVAASSLQSSSNNSEGTP